MGSLEERLARMKAGEKEKSLQERLAEMKSPALTRTVSLPTAARAALEQGSAMGALPLGLPGGGIMAPRTTTVQTATPRLLPTGRKPAGVNMGYIRAEAEDRRRTGDFTLPGGREDRVAALERKEAEVRSVLTSLQQPNGGIGTFNAGANEARTARIKKLQGQLEELAGELTAEKDAGWREDQAQDRRSLEGVRARPGFQAAALAGAETNVDLWGRWAPGRRLAAELVNPSLREHNRNMGVGSEADQLDALTDEERDTLLYYIGMGEYDKVQEYFNLLERDLNARRQAGYTAEDAAQAEAHPFQGAAKNVLASFASPLAYMSNALQTGKNAITGAYEPTDPNSDGFRGAHMVNATAQGVSQAGTRMPLAGGIEIAGKNVGSFLAETGLSMGQFAAKLPTGAMALPLMGAGAAGQTTLDVLERGGTNGQAFSMGTANGLIEIATEKIGLDHLFAIAGRTGAAGVKRALLDVGGQMLAEGSEEAISEAAGNLVDLAVMGDKSGVKQYAAQLVAEGMSQSEAESAALKQFFLVNTGWAAAGGALSGGAMGGAATAGRGLMTGAEAAALEESDVLRMPLPTEGGTAPIGQKKTASTRETAYRAEIPQNMELPTVPIINLSMEDVAELNQGVLPDSGNYLRKTATERAKVRLGLDQNSAAYIPASNVLRNGDEYILKITKASLDKMFHPSDGGTVPVETVAIMENLERIANNGVYFRSEGDRKGRDQMLGVDHLMTTVYIDGAPYVVDMRVRVLQEGKIANKQNVLYYFTPEAITAIKKADGGTPAAGRPASDGEVPPSSNIRIAQSNSAVNLQSAQNLESHALAGPNDLHIDQRTWKDAGSRKMNAFQYDHPELHSYFADAARGMLYDLRHTAKGERTAVKDREGYVTGVTGTARATSSAVEIALDDAGLSYQQIETALKNLIADHGQENYAAAKKVELVLDTVLSEGYTDVDGQEYGPSEDYISAKNLLKNGLDDGRTDYRMSEEEWSSLMGEVDSIPRGPYDEVNSVGAMGNPYKANVKISRVRTNTFERSGLFSEVEKQMAGLKPEDFVYDKVTELESMGRAAQRLETDYEGEVADLPVKAEWSGEDLDTSMGILRQEINLARQDGDYAAVRDWAKRIQAKGTAGGQFLQAFAKYTRTPDGILVKAVETLEQAEVEPEMQDRVLDAMSGFAETLDSIRQQEEQAVGAAPGATPAAPDAVVAAALAQLQKDHGVPVELWKQALGNDLADRLAANAMPQVPKQKTLTQIVLGDLVRFAQEHAVPNRRTVKAARTATDQIRDYLNNRPLYNQTWQTAQSEIREIYAEQPDMLDAFEAWIESTISYNGAGSDKVMLSAVVENALATGNDTKTVLEKIALGDRLGLAQAVANQFLEALGDVSATDTVVIRDAVRRWTANVAEERGTAKDLDRLIGRAMKEIGTTLNQSIQNKNTQEAQRKITDLLKEKYGAGEESAARIAETVTRRFDTMVTERVAELHKVSTEDVAKLRAANGDALVEIIKKQAKQRNTKVSAVTEKALRAQNTQYLYDFALTQLENIAVDYEKVSAGRKLSTYQAFSHLFNGNTALRNVVSNQVFDVLDTVANNVSVLPDMLLAVCSKRRTVGLEGSWLSTAKRRGALDGGRRGWAEVALDVDMGSATKYGTGGRRANKMIGTLPGRLASTAEKAMGFELNVTDEFHKGSVEAEVLDSLEALVGKGYLTQEEAVAWAKQEALYRSFQDDTLPGTVLGQLRDVLNLVGIGDSGKKLRGRTVHEFGLGDLVQKYTQVPGALMSRAVEFSPLGYGKVLWTAGKAVLSGGLDASAQRKAALAIGRASTGTGLVALFAVLAAGGLLNRADDEDDRDIAALNAAEGIGGTQLNLSGLERWISKGDPRRQSGDTLMSVDFLEPLNALMTIGALIAQDASDRGLVGKAAAASMDGTFQSIMDTPTMQSLASVYNTSRYHKEGDMPLWLEIPVELAKGSVTGFVPGLVRKTAQITDNVYRETYSSDDPLVRTGDAMKNALPGLRETLPVKVTPFGADKKDSTAGGLRFFNTFFMPGALTTYRQSEVSNELQSLRAETGNDSIYPGRAAPKSIRVQGEDRTLSAEEREAYQRTRGQTTYEVMESLLDCGLYESISRDGQAEVMAEAVTYGDVVAKMEADPRYKPEDWVVTAQGMTAEERADFLVVLQILRTEGGSGEGATDRKREALVEMDGLSDEDKARLGGALLGDTRELDYSSQAALDVSLLDEGPREKAGEAEDAGIGAEAFLGAYEAQKGIVGDKNADGNTIPLSASRKKKNAIDYATPGLSTEQREMLYELFGVSKNVW